MTEFSMKIPTTNQTAVLWGDKQYLTMTADRTIRPTQFTFAPEPFSAFSLVNPTFAFGKFTAELVKQGSTLPLGTLTQLAGFKNDIFFTDAQGNRRWSIKRKGSSFWEYFFVGPLAMLFFTREFYILNSLQQTIGSYKMKMTPESLSFLDGEYEKLSAEDFLIIVALTRFCVQ